MPELPEVEITARRLDAALRGAEIESALAPGINALKTFDPPLSALAGGTIAGVRRRGKQLIVDVVSDVDANQRDVSDVGANQRGGKHDGADNDGGEMGSGGERLALLIHLMSAGRLQLYDKRAGPRDRTSRLLVRVRLRPSGDRSAGDSATAGGSPEAELRLREFGSKQAAWVKLLRASDLEREEALTTLGPEAWPDPGDPQALRELLNAPRPLHAMLRDQRTIAGIGRSWVDEILWEAQLSPYKRGADLTGEEAVRLRQAIVNVLGSAIDHYERTIALPIPDKLPMPLRVHRHEGGSCPRCGETLRSVHFEDYVIAYCPACQTEGRVLKDRRLSRLLK